MTLLVLGDAHASDPDRRESLLETYRAVDPDAVLHVGDLECYDLPAPTWFVAGNNEDLDVIEYLRRKVGWDQSGEEDDANAVQTHLPGAEPISGDEGAPTNEDAKAPSEGVAKTSAAECAEASTDEGTTTPETVDAEVRNVHLLASTAATVEGLRVAGLSGNYALTQHDRSRGDLEGDRRRHFTHEDVERAAELVDGDETGERGGGDAGERDDGGDGEGEGTDEGEDIDVFLAHEAPLGLLSYGYDPGCEHVNRLLRDLSPSLCLVGHHHCHREAEIEGVRVVSLAPTWERYYTLEPETLRLEAHDPP
ncbi:hypothetical protein ACFQGT_11940 [Natrialbaceae archaeon GCM10025810]|uniref:metallophosphoesterase family protein n=1 Tax=Halovalidus salilacus TaxID=3075124 RepID=UPI00360E970A